ncbi:hypothetical protein E0Z10_g8073 [Xylaria hypoxylon]|uniref:Zn(2)-C6 fungal-type domain-containing protein n=1 Tax=Xylaria hypoxylon TaxID=37992 RepID=A0A4Z0YQH0_9PEZI|nr:hypothetical protein E0Z10_g8073 [Xylaria hypoxylon]
MDEGDLDYDIGHEASFDLDMFSLPMDDTGFLPPGSSPSSVVTSGDIAEDSAAQAQKRYLSKRPHKKSRAGCKQCKKRKVKCDEAKPTCKACTLRKEKCIYPDTPPSVLPSTAKHLPTGTTSSLPLREAREQLVESIEEAEEVESVEDAAFMHDMIPVVSEPLFIPEQAADVMDMKMLWFYTTHSFQNFAINSGRSPVIDHILKVKIVEHAFRSPFLMETLKALSALHLRVLNQPIPNQKLVAYQAKAFQGYRNAIEKADPIDFPALLGCSLLTVALSSQSFREPNGKRLFVVDWIAVWRGIGLIIELIEPQAVHDSGLAALFYRPPIDMEKSAQYIPNNLLFMVTSIKYGDADYGYQKDYYELLRYLGSLYMELTEHGFGPVLDLRVITFFTFCPRPLLPLMKQYRPRVLVIIAYWLCFVKLLHHGSWWMRGLDPQAAQIFEEIGENWGHLLRVPRMVMQTDNYLKIARLIIDNHNWTPSELDLYNKHRDPRAKNDLKFITNAGAEIEIVEGNWQFKSHMGGAGIEIKDGKWQFKSCKVSSDIPQVDDPDADLDLSNEKLLLGSGLVYKIAQYDTASAMPSVSALHGMSTPSPGDSSSTSSTPGLSPSKSQSKSPSP